MATPLTGASTVAARAEREARTAKLGERATIMTNQKV